LTESEATPADPPDGCTEVLLGAPREVAERVRSFLHAHSIPSLVRETSSEGTWQVLVRPVDPTPTSEGTSVGEEVPASPTTAADDGEPMVLCELTWTDAWRLTERLIAAGIPAAVMAGEGGDRDKPMSARTVPVGVRPEDLDRARAFLQEP
jgi:hypothetical protein